MKDPERDLYVSLEQINNLAKALDWYNRMVLKYYNTFSLNRDLNTEKELKQERDRIFMLVKKVNKDFDKSIFLIGTEPKKFQN